MELAIDTSTNYAGICLSEKGMIITEFTWITRQNHTRELLPNIRTILSQNNTSIESIEAIIVATGPGSFNGLRVGLSTAKGLSFALNIPVAGVSTLEAEAYPFAFTNLPIYPIHNAGRGEIATALYQQNINWECLQKEYLTTIDQLCNDIKVETIICGEVTESAIAQIKEKFGKLAIIPDANTRLRRPGHLAKLGWQRIKSGQCNNQHTLEPIYLRQPPITQSKKRIVKQ